jgi:hypothetical protein
MPARDIPGHSVPESQLLYRKRFRHCPFWWKDYIVPCMDYVTSLCGKAKPWASESTKLIEFWGSLLSKIENQIGLCHLGQRTCNYVISCLFASRCILKTFIAKWWSQSARDLPTCDIPSLNPLWPEISWEYCILVFSIYLTMCLNYKTNASTTELL